MNINFSIKQNTILKISHRFKTAPWQRIIFFLSVFFAVLATGFSYSHNYIITYGDAESHLDIAKRVIDGLTPGFAQLGGIWLPLPHVLMLPFISFDFLWRTGLAGSIVSGLAFIISAIFIYKITFLLTKNNLASAMASIVFISNPNILYVQSTPLTEMTLIVFFILSSYYFVKFLMGKNNILSLILAAAFGFCATLSRYDGWFLVIFEALILVIVQIPISTPYLKLLKNIKNIKFLKHINIFNAKYKKTWEKIKGTFILFSTLAFFGIVIWLIWDLLILGDPLYFTNSQFSAKSQQQSWLLKNELPAYHNIISSFLYYFFTSMSAVGIVIFAVAIIGLVMFLLDKNKRNSFAVSLILLVPFMFYVATLFIGQSVIFIPSLTPVSFEWRLFNTRYGVMMVPAAAIFFAYVFHKTKISAKLLLTFLFVIQIGLYLIGYSKVITLADGTEGLSRAKSPNAEIWLRKNYDGGLVLLDDYARTVSIIRSGIPMQNVIYVGSKPYWEESLAEPEKYAKWIVVQNKDDVYKYIYNNPVAQGRLYKYFEKAYTSPNILVFKRINETSIIKSYMTPTFLDNNNREILWPIQSIDTMKYSRDESRNPNIHKEIPDIMKKVSDLGATHVAIATPYNEEFYPVLEAWVKEARKYNLKVWFRGNFAEWEGWFGYPKNMTPEEHNFRTYQFITSHPELFKLGDIFTPAPEPENGSMGDPRSSSQVKDEFNKFLVNSYNNCNEAFNAINVKVNCGYFSTNGDVAKESLTRDTVQKIGNTVVIDHYIKDPKQLFTDLDYLHKKYNANIVLGEFGAPIPDINGNMTETEQAKFVDELMQQAYENKKYVTGVNYWTIKGSTTALYNDNDSARKVTKTIKQYYAPNIVRGTVDNTLGEPVANVGVKTQDGLNATLTDKDGRFFMLVPATDNQIYVMTNDYKTEKVDILASNKQSVINLTLKPKVADSFYEVKNLLRKIKLL